MQLKKVEIIKYRNFENIIINLDKQENFPNIFSIASKNGGGKSTLIQFIFIMLHCFMDKTKHKYIKNLLEEFSEITEDIELVKFSIENNNIIYNLDFLIINLNYTEDFNFNLYLDLEDTKNKIHQYQNNIREYNRILELKNEIDNNERITPIIQKNLRYIREYIKTTKEDELFDEARRTKDINLYKILVDGIIKKNSISSNSLDDLEMIYQDIQNNLKVFEQSLEISNTQYITHLTSNQNVLVLKTKMPTELLLELTNKVFLSAPSSQVFLFLSNEEKHNIFNEFGYEVERNIHYGFSHQSYNESIKRAKSNLEGFYTYDFASTELILQSFRKANDEDSKIMRRSGKYGSKYNDLTKELKGFLDGKEISENEDGNRVIFKSIDGNQELLPEDLSHGELKKLGIYIWLKYIVPSDAIILMDEIDIALHPKWQYQLIKDLSKWSCNSQFLLATHSPQILSSTYYKNIIKLDNGKVTRYKHPPIDRDINAIIVEIMEAPDFPEDLLELHKSYRKLVNNKEHKTDNGKILRAEILEYESENSSFFQEMNFHLELI